MKPRRESNHADRQWDAWTARAGRSLTRGPFTLTEAQQAFDSAGACILSTPELDTICQAGRAVYGDMFERSALPDSSRGVPHRPLPRHPLQHEWLDRRDLPAPLSLFVCTADFSGIVPESPPTVEVPTADASWNSDFHWVDRAAWRGTGGWTPQTEVPADTPQTPSPFEWQDTFAAEATLALSDLAAVLAPTTTDVTHDAVFMLDAWRDGLD